MKKSLCTFLLAIAMPLTAETEWEAFKNDTISEMETIPGWCSTEKALLMMDVIKENQCQRCVEVGVFSGKSLFPIAKALQYNGSGIVFGIDAWDPSEAVKGYETSDPNYTWWNQLDFNSLYNQTLKLVQKNHIYKFCNIIKLPAQDAACLFEDETIDFLHLDGNHTAECAIQDLMHYFPKVKDGGYILLNDPNWLCMKCSLVFLLERADTISPFSPAASFMLFRKNNQRMQNASLLLEDERL